LGVADAHFGEHLEALVVLLGPLEYFGTAKESFQELAVAAFFFVQHVLEVLHRLLLQVLLRGGKVDPSFESMRSQTCGVDIEDFLDDLTGALELLCVPQESGSAEKVLVRRLLFALVKLQHKCIDRLLIDVAAPLMIKNERNRRRELNFTALLDPRELTDSFSNASFVENAECLPESQNGVLTLAKLLQPSKTHQVRLTSNTFTVCLHCR